MLQWVRNVVSQNPTVNLLDARLGPGDAIAADNVQIIRPGSGYCRDVSTRSPGWR